jgi:hypothetical protein
MGAMKELKIKDSLMKLTELRDYLVSELAKRDFVSVNSPENALPYIVNLSLKGLRSETVLNLLSDMEIYVSSGSACSKGHKSPVLTAMGLDDSLIDSSLRVSMSRFTTKEQLDYFLQGIDTAHKVISSAWWAMRLRHCLPVSSRMAEMRVPAWPSPIQKTKSTISHPQGTALLTPSTPTPSVAMRTALHPSPHVANAAHNNTGSHKRRGAVRGMVGWLIRRLLYQMLARTASNKATCF